MSGFETIAAIASVAGTATSILGTIKGGRAQSKRFKYEQKVKEQQADEAVAASQRDARARYREGELIESQQRAGVAAAGGGMTEGGVLDIMGDTKEQVGLAAETELYKGDQQAKGYSDAANIAGVNAKTSMNNAWLTAGGQLFSGVSSMYKRFGASQAAGQSSGGNTASLWG